MDASYGRRREFEELKVANPGGVEFPRIRIGLSVIFVLSGRHGLGAREDHLDVSLGEPIRDLPGLPPARDDEPDVLLLGPFNGVADISCSVGAKQDRDLLVYHACHGLELEVPAHRGS